MVAATGRAAGDGVDMLLVPLAGSDSQSWRELLATAAHKDLRSGSERACPPAETLERVRPHLASVGITRIANVTGLDRIGIPVVMVCRPNSRSLATSQGKGMDLVSATVSGVMESIELHHAERIMLPLVLATTVEIARSRRLADLSGLPRIVNSRFHAHIPLLWIEGQDILAGAPAWLPFETVHASAAVPAPSGSGCFASTSNGLASGNNLVEALVHALLEVIERDAVSVWGARGEEHRRRTAIDLETVTHPGCRRVIDAIGAAGAEVAAFDATSDTGIPAFLCEVSETQFDPGTASVFSGLGCHMDRGLALVRAMTEAVQSRLTLIAGSRDDLSRRDYREVAASVSGHHAERPRRAFGDVRSLPVGASSNEDLELICERLLAVGVEEVIAVDLTRPEYGIPVVRVVVPRLEGPDDDPEYVPGPRALRALEEQP